MKTDRNDENSRQTAGQSLKDRQQTRDRRTDGQGQKEPEREKDRVGIGAVLGSWAVCLPSPPRPDTGVLHQQGGADGL